MIIDALEYLKQPLSRQSGKSNMELRLRQACFECIKNGYKYFEYEVEFVDNGFGWLSPDIKIKEMLDV